MTLNMFIYLHFEMHRCTHMNQALINQLIRLYFARIHTHTSSLVQLKHTRIQIINTASILDNRSRTPGTVRSGQLQ